MDAEPPTDAQPSSDAESSLDPESSLDDGDDLELQESTDSTAGDPSPETPESRPASITETVTQAEVGEDAALADIAESLDVSEELRAIVDDTRQAMLRRLKGPERGRGEGMARRDLVGDIKLETRGYSTTVTDRENVEEVRIGRGGLVDAHCSCQKFSIEGGCRHVWAALVVAARQLGLGGWRAEKTEVRKDDRERREHLDAIVEAAGAEEGASPWEGLEKEAFLRVEYVLDVPSPGTQAGFSLHIRRRRRRADGTWGASLDLGRKDWDDIRTARHEDVEIVALLDGPGGKGRAASGYEAAPTVWHLGGPGSTAAMEVIAQTGRLYLGTSGDGSGRSSSEGPVPAEPVPLTEEEAQEREASDLPTALRSEIDHPWRVRLAIGHDDGDDATLVLSGMLERGDEQRVIREVTMLSSDGHAIIDGAFTTVEPHAAAGVASVLRQRGELRTPSGGEARLRRSLAQLGQGAMAPGSLEVGPRMSPLLVVRVPTDEAPGKTLEAEITFQYGTRSVAADTYGWSLEDEAGRVFSRDLDAERTALRQFLDSGGSRKLDPEDEIASARVPAKDLEMVIARLIEDGWSVEADGKRVRSSTGSNASVRSGIDWFDLEGNVVFEGQEVPFPELLAAAERGAKFVTLPDGSRGLLPKDWVSRWKLLEVGDLEDGKIRFKKDQGWVLSALLERQPPTDGLTIDEPFANLRALLSDASTPESISEPEDFIGELRPYQREGLGWLNQLAGLGLGGCLADDMGLGKTVQILAYFVLRANAANAMEAAEAKAAGKPAPEERGFRRPSLVVAPRSLVFNWRAEAAKFSPKLVVVDYTGPDREHALITSGTPDIVLTTYGTLRRDAAELAEIDFDLVVLDEAQAIKNATSQTAAAARGLKARQRLALSGTPVENHLGELGSLLEFLNPGTLEGTRLGKRLRAKGRSPRLDDESRGILVRAVRPFLLRRTKDEVLDDLPPKTEQVLECTLDGKQRADYEELRTHFRTRFTQSGSRGGVEVLQALLRLRQTSCHPGLVDETRQDESSAKLDVVLPLVEELVDQGHKALIFSQFTGFLGIVRRALDARGIKYAYLDGSTRKRENEVNLFQNDPDTPIFLVSLKAGGTGLNLTAADYVFLLDPWWNPAVEAQAIDRAHRIGRMNPVHVYRIIAKDTIEERVRELQEKKRDLAAAVLGGA
ncbi:MAG: superfamily II DNA or RNA helicase, partial [Paracoccaceae bacterium]